MNIRDEQATQPMGILAFATYALAFATAVGLAEPFTLGLPAGLLAIWWVAQHIADRYQRQITVGETLWLAVGSWLGTLLSKLLPAVFGTEPLEAFLFLFVVPLWVLKFISIWAAYYWFARFVIHRKLNLQEPLAQPSTAAEMIAEQHERSHEHTARVLTLAVTGVSLIPLGFLLIFPLVGLIGAVLSVAVGLQLGTGLAMVVTLVTLFGGGVFWIQRKSAQVFPSRRLLLWLRRFHRPELLEFPFPGFLESVCRGIAVPVTLQDTSVSHAPNAAEQRPAFHVMHVLSILALFTFFTTLFGFFQDHVVESAVSAFVALSVFVFANHMAQRFGFVDLRTGIGKRLVGDLLERVRSDQGVPQTLTVISTSDESWRHWVSQFIDEADVVLIDVTELSEHLYWELQTVAERVDAAQLILAFGVNEGGEPQLPDHMNKQLSDVIGEHVLAHCQRFFYELPLTSIPSDMRQQAGVTPGWEGIPKAQMDAYRARFMGALKRAFAAADARQAAD